MRIIVRLLEEKVLKRAKEVSLCQTPEAERIMRLLMADLLIALRAESERIAERRNAARGPRRRSRRDAVSHFLVLGN